MYPGDVYAINDPYAGGTHFSDVRLIRPIFNEETLIGFSQSNGHWSDLGGSVPGSFNVAAHEMFGEAVRITPVRLFHKGKFCADVANMIAANTPRPGLHHRGHSFTGAGHAGGRSARYSDWSPSTGVIKCCRACARCRTTSSARSGSGFRNCRMERGKRWIISTATPGAGEGMIPDPRQDDD